jgi:hypothetical protein
MLRPPLRCHLLALAVATAAAAPPSFAQRNIQGVDDEEDEGDAPKKGDDAPAKDDKKSDAKKKADPKKKADDKKVDEKKADDKNASDDKKVDDTKSDGKKASETRSEGKKSTPGDVLDETAEEKKKRSAEDEARKKADEAAAAEEAKQAAERARVAEEKKANAEKRRVETRDQRLASAKRVRPLTRDEGDYHVAVAVEPGAVQKGALVEVRFDIGKKLDVADPKFGNRQPLKNLALTATVIEPSGKKDAKRLFAVHSLGAPGQYGFHMTPPKDGVLQVQLTGDVGDRTLDVSFPLHVGVWPPPDFDDEDKKVQNVDGKGG